MIYFELIAAVSLFCLGIRAITDDGMIGHPVRLYFMTHFPKAGKPLILCSTCMSSVWGTLIFWGHHAYSFDTLTSQSVFLWLGVVFSAAFVNSVLWAYYESINMCKTK